MAALLHIPTEIIFGEDALEKAAIESKRILLIYNPKMPKHVLGKVHSVFQKFGNNIVNLGFGNGEPDSNRINEAYNKIATETEVIVAIGGGSLIDFAKAIGILLHSGGDITEYEFGERSIIGTKPVYVLPTVFGSGSEVTPYTVINNSITGRKFTLGNTLLRPDKAIVVPNLIESGISNEIKLISGIDAFIHCFESLVSKQENDLIQPLAIEGIRVGWKLLSDLASGQSIPMLNIKLAKLSLLGGCSISHCRTGLIHTLSVAFAKYLRLPHGLLNAIMVKYAVSHHLPHYNGLLASIFNSALQTSFENDEEAYNQIQHWFDTLIHHLAKEVKFVELPDADKIVNRLMQDKGLPGVSHGPITEAHLRTIVNQIIYETRS